LNCGIRAGDIRFAENSITDYGHSLIANLQIYPFVASSNNRAAALQSTLDGSVFARVGRES